MAFIDDAVSKTKDVANKVGKKASELVEEVKLNLKISDIQGDIEKTYAKIGHLIFDAKKGGTDPSGDVDAIIADIDELYEKLSDTKRTLAELKRRKICENCQKSNPEENNFCAFCGKEL